MDSFTLTVVIADIAMLAAFVALLVLDKTAAPVPIEPSKPAGKRSA